VGLFDGVLARGSVPGDLSDDAWLQAMLDTEAALARASAEAGVIPAAAAKAIAAACASVYIDVSELSAAAAESGNPVVPLVQRLRAEVPAKHARFVHFGATSQDILDTASMLILKRALSTVLDDLAGAADAAADLARRHRDTVMAGRTLLQQALPTTFGLKAAGWMHALDTARDRLAQVRRERLAVEFGGAAGTLAGLDGKGVEIVERLAAALGLCAPVLPWHTDRTRLAEVAAALGEAAGAVAKAARDVTLLAQGEVAEVSEGAPGGSSAMAHKQNPVAAISALAGAAQAPGLVATLLGAMVHEHERAAGSWHAEWRPLRELLIATGSAASWLRTCLSELAVHPEAMRANLDRLLNVLGTEEPDTGMAAALVDQALRTRQTGGPT